MCVYLVSKQKYAPTKLENIIFSMTRFSGAHAFQASRSFPKILSGAR